jgi:hypothetical protein
MRLFDHPISFAALLLTIAGACRGVPPIPPTQPQVNQDPPATSTNDAPTAGPMASDVLGAGGTNILPSPPPAPGGSGGGPAAH